jgi:hypothetical protein
MYSLKVMTVVGVYGEGDDSGGYMVVYGVIYYHIIDFKIEFGVSK